MPHALGGFPSNGHQLLPRKRRRKQYPPKNPKDRRTRGYAKAITLILTGLSKDESLLDDPICEQEKRLAKFRVPERGQGKQTSCDHGAAIRLPLPNEAAEQRTLSLSHWGSFRDTPYIK